MCNDPTTQRTSRLAAPELPEQALGRLCCIRVHIVTSFSQVKDAGEARSAAQLRPQIYCSSGHWKNGARRRCITELFEIAVELDVEQVVHAICSPLNVVDLEPRPTS